jgi:hypothetical protein
VGCLPEYQRRSLFGFVRVLTPLGYSTTRLTAVNGLGVAGVVKPVFGCRCTLTGLHRGSLNAVGALAWITVL